MIYKPKEKVLMSQEESDFEFAGFGIRFLASMIDTIIISIVFNFLYLLLFSNRSGQNLVGSVEIIIFFVLPAIAIMLFWYFRSASPGKMILGIELIDLETGDKLHKSQIVARYFCYYLSLLPLGLGFLWVIWDPKKQGWHDKLANTAVVKATSVGDRYDAAKQGYQTFNMVANPQNANQSADINNRKVASGIKGSETSHAAMGGGYEGCKIEIGDQTRPCAAVLKLSGKVFLAAEAPQLPLPDCDTENCSCRYITLKDRRQGPRRVKKERRESIRMEDGNRRSGKDRRKSNNSPFGDK